MVFPIKPYHFDLLQELINIGVGKAACMLNKMVKVHIELQVPRLEFYQLGVLMEDDEFKKIHSLSAVILGFNGTFAGTSALMFPPDSASNLVSIVIGQQDMQADMDSMRIGTLQEVGNIVLNGVIGSIANILQEPLDYSTLDYCEGAFNTILPEYDLENDTILLARTQFTLEEHSICGDILIVFQVGSFDSLIEALDRCFPEGASLS